MKKIILLLAFISFSNVGFAQQDNDLGAWYIYFGNFRFTESPWAIHGEAQYRNHNTIGDLEQLLLRTGLQYNHKSGNASFLAGYGSITSQAEGDATNSIHENRVYQEVILKQTIGKVGFMHRFRYEQRWIEIQDFRTRFRYAVFVNVPINSIALGEKGSWYVQGYDELFINGEKLDDKVEYFDRNRLYLGLGYRVRKNLAFQVGFMQQATDSKSKTYLQFTAFHQLYSR